MKHLITNYDGGIATYPQQLVFPRSIEEIQAVLRDVSRYPSPVRAMGSFHSLTPCASTDGTIISMSRMDKVIRIDPVGMTLTAQAGVQVIDAAKALRPHNLQLVTNIEIGNMTLGAAACCHSKDGLDGAEFGQASSYVTNIKWVTPKGELSEASESRDPELLRFVRSSYGLCGVIYEVTFRITPLQAVHFSYLPRPVRKLTENEVDRIIDASEGLICWTVGDKAHFQTRRRAERVGPFGPLFAAVRRRLWNHTEARVGRFIDRRVPTEALRHLAHESWFASSRLIFSALHLVGGSSLYNPDKIVDYRSTPASAKYAFTFWTFPRQQWLGTLKEYLEFSERHFRRYDFRCNMPLGSYYIKRDQNSLLSYSHGGDVFSIDPIHAYSDKGAWDRFLEEFNEFASTRGGIPLLNQSPFVNRNHVEAAYGSRWTDFSRRVAELDPDRRMLNPFFADLLS
jgi:hypothetical protein